MCFYKDAVYWYLANVLGITDEFEEGHPNVERVYSEPLIEELIENGIVDLTSMSGELNLKAISENGAVTTLIINK